MACFTNFCPTCCEPTNTQCVQDCQKAHLTKAGEKDPEEIFINVCKSSKMIDSMKPFCQKFYSSSDV